MHINLSPFRSDKSLSIEKLGNTFTINGVTYDFTALPDGATLPASAINCEFIVGPVERIDGVLHLTLLLPHGADASEAVRFPEPIINPPDGPLELPQ